MISPSQSSQPVFAIVISEKGGAERREVYDRPEISVGRVQGNDLTLPKGNVSKRHARLIFRDGRFIVTDLNSTNGTYVNRRRISQATIVREGDRIYIGDFVLRIELPEGTSEPSTGAEQTGSGPVPARPEVSSESGATAFPAEREAEEVSGASYPQVPGPPRVPSSPAPRQAAQGSAQAAQPQPPQPPRGSEASFSDSHPSEKLPLASVVDVSHADIDIRAMLANDPGTRSARGALAAVLGRVLSFVDPAELEGDVTEALRTRFERLVEERAHELRSQGELPPDVDLARVSHDARAELLELGPIGPLLVDPTVTEIVASRFDAVSAVRSGRPVVVEPGLSSEDGLRRVVRRLCRAAGQPMGNDERVVERRLRDGSRLWAALAPAAPAGLLVIQKPRRVGASLEELVRSGTISRAIATFLGQCVAARLNVLVVGPRDLGTSAVLGAVASAAVDSRLVVLQEIDDAAPDSEWVSRMTLPENAKEAARVVLVASRVPGARLVVELTSPDVTGAVVDAVGSGLTGVVAAAHASSLRHGLARLAADVASTRVGTACASARDWVAATFDVAVEIGRLRDTRLRALRVAELAGVAGDEIRTQDVFTFTAERTAAGGAVEGSFSASGAVPRVAEDMAARGFALESSIFSRPPSR